MVRSVWPEANETVQWTVSSDERRRAWASGRGRLAFVCGLWGRAIRAGVLIVRSQFSPAARPLKLLTRGAAWHLFAARRAANKWSEREDWRKQALACFRLRYAQIGLRPPRRACRPFVEPLNWFRQKNGRRERIRTSGPYVPNVVLYQAELLSEPVRWGTPRLGRRPYNDGPPPPQPDCKPLSVRPFLTVCGPARLALYGGPARGDPCLMGRRQAVRHRILIPACGGSIPPAPASSILHRYSAGIPGRSLWLAAFGPQIGPLDRFAPLSRVAPYPSRPSQFSAKGLVWLQCRGGPEGSKTVKE